jgi:hypothetical protein
MLVAPLLLAAAIDGPAALGHAKALAALGARGFGSPRSRAAAEYVASQLRAAGLSEVALQEFEAGGQRGANAVAVLRAPGPGFVVIGAHHDTVAGSPGAYDDAAGVGVVIEAARVLTQAKQRPRTLVFASWDGQEAGPDGAPGARGARAYIDSLGVRARELVAAVDVEMCGFAGGGLVLHALAYPDPLRPGRSVTAPAWLVRSALAGAEAAGAPLAVGDPLASLLYQPAVRTFSLRLHGGDLAFLQAGLPAVMLSDSSLAYFQPNYHTAGDTAEKLDRAALDRAGAALLGIAERLAREERPAEPDPHWLSLFGGVLGGWPLAGLSALSLAPGLALALRARGRFLYARLAQAALFALLAWRYPVPALFAFALPNALSPWLERAWARSLTLLPLLALLAFGAVGWARRVPEGRIVTGTWLSGWEVALTLAALALLAVPAGARAWKTVRSPKPRKRGR